VQDAAVAEKQQWSAACEARTRRSVGRSSPQARRTSDRRRTLGPRNGPTCSRAQCLGNAGAALAAAPVVSRRRIRRGRLRSKRGGPPVLGLDGRSANDAYAEFAAASPARRNPSVPRGGGGHPARRMKAMAGVPNVIGSGRSILRWPRPAPDRGRGRHGDRRGAQRLESREHLFVCWRQCASYAVTTPDPPAHGGPPSPSTRMRRPASCGSCCSAVRWCAIRSRPNKPWRGRERTGPG
jgi:hypothetical protein